MSDDPIDAALVWAHNAVVYHDFPESEHHIAILAAEVRRLRARLTPEGLVAAFHAANRSDEYMHAVKSADGPLGVTLDGHWDFDEVIRELVGKPDGE